MNGACGADRQRLSTDVDVLIVGAGLSGIGAAHHLGTAFPDRRYTILSNVRGTVAEAGIDRHIRFGHRVVRASWSTADARWTSRAGR